MALRTRMRATRTFMQLGPWQIARARAHTHAHAPAQAQRLRYSQERVLSSPTAISIEWAGESKMAKSGSRGPAGEGRGKRIELDVPIPLAGTAWKQTAVQVAFFATWSHCDLLASYSHLQQGSANFCEHITLFENLLTVTDVIYRHTYMYTHLKVCLLFQLSHESLAQ